LAAKKEVVQKTEKEKKGQIKEIRYNCKKPHVKEDI